MKIFITGVSSGIGKELASILAKDSHEVWGVGRRELSGADFVYSQCDVSDESQVDQVIAEMGEKDFLPDVVVLNSAYFPRDLSTGDFDWAEAERAFEVNYAGALTWVGKFLPKFLERESGKFVAVCSTSAFRPDPSSVSLPASKAALSMAFRSFRLRYPKNKVQFATVYFGPVATPMVPEFTKSSGQKKHFFVLSARAAAEKLKKAVLGSRDRYYFPFWLTLFFRAGLIFPDNWFAKLSKEIKK